MTILLLVLSITATSALSMDHSEYLKSLFFPEKEIQKKPRKKRRTPSPSDFILAYQASTALQQKLSENQSSPVSPSSSISSLENTATPSSSMSITPTAATTPLTPFSVVIPVPLISSYTPSHHTQAPSKASAAQHVPLMLQAKCLQCDTLYLVPNHRTTTDYQAKETLYCPQHSTSEPLPTPRPLISPKTSNEQSAYSFADERK